MLSENDCFVTMSINVVDEEILEHVDLAYCCYLRQSVNAGGCFHLAIIYPAKMKQVFASR